MSIHARLNPTFDPNPTALVAWDGISGRWYTELQGVPAPDYVFIRHETLDDALEWARARAPRVTFQDPETTANPVVTPENAALLDRMRRQEILSTPADESLHNVRPVNKDDLPATPDGRAPLDTVESWYLLEMWDDGTYPDDGEAWRIGGENGVTDVLRWVAEVVGRREWTLRVVSADSGGEVRTTWLFGNSG